MHIRFAAPELEVLDGLACEALAVPLFSDERPLAGVLGLVDWRMCGFVSRMLLEGRIAGEPNEHVLLPGRPKLAMEKLFVFGLGPERSFGPALVVGCVSRMLRTLQAARVRSAALVLPGRHTDRIDAATAVEALIAAIAAAELHDDIVVIEPLEAQRAMEPVIERERRRTRAGTE